MARLTNSEIFEQMAYTKAHAYKDEKWYEISSWSMFMWSDVSRLIKNGKLKTTMHKSNTYVWVTPTAETYLGCIEPLVKKLL